MTAPSVHLRRFQRLARPDRALEGRDRVVEAARDPRVLEGAANSNLLCELYHDLSRDEWFRGAGL